MLRRISTLTLRLFELLRLLRVGTKAKRRGYSTSAAESLLGQLARRGRERCARRVLEKLRKGWRAYNRERYAALA